MTVEQKTYAHIRWIKQKKLALQVQSKCAED